MKQEKYRYLGVTLSLFSLLYSGCARIDAVATNVLSSGMRTVAVVNEQVMTGKLRLFPDRTGDLVLQNEKPDNTGLKQHCTGRLWFTAARQGTIDVRCSDGWGGDLSFVMVGDISGYAYIHTSDVSMAFGMAEEKAISYLRIAPPKRLVLNAETGDIEVNGFSVPSVPAPTDTPMQAPDK